MTRYIDADKLKEDILEENSWYLYNEFGSTTQFHELIDKQPTADVVEVVRCKDCCHIFDGDCPITWEKTDDDLISRQDAIDAINHICPIDTEYDCTLLDSVDVIYVLSDLPSADRPTGKWIENVVKWGNALTTVHGYRCSNCGALNLCKDKFCPNCGAKMGGSKWKS